MGAFGEKLRKQREQQGIALDAISDTTKISTRMLRALEDEHFDQLPGGVFNKGFVRAYARQVGLNEEEAIADYLAAVREISRAKIRASESTPARPAPAIFLTIILQATIIPATTPAASFSPRIGASSFAVTKIVATKIAETKIPTMSCRDEAPRHQDLSSSTDSTQPVPHRRFRQKYPAGNPERSDSSPTYDSAAEIPWGKLAVALLLVTLTLALWNSRRHREPASAPLPALASNQAPPAAPSHRRQRPIQNSRPALPPPLRAKRNRLRKYHRQRSLSGRTERDGVHRCRHTSSELVLRQSHA